MNDPIIGKDDKLDSSDEDIEEDIDKFLDSQMSDDIAGTEGKKKDSKVLQNHLFINLMINVETVLLKNVFIFFR